MSGWIKHCIPTDQDSALKIPEDPLFIPEWFNKGINLASDVVDEQGNFMSIRNLQILYNIEDINFLQYLKIKINTLNFMKNNNFLNEPILRPVIPHHIKIIFKSNKGAKDFNKYAQCSLKNEHSMKEKWNEENWTRIFKVCHHTIPDNVLIWFKLRIIYRILGTKYCL